MKKDDNSKEISDMSIENINKKIELEIQELKEEEVIAFVDGSYTDNINEEKKCSFGAILITNNLGNISENLLYKAFTDKERLEKRNVAGEIEGVKQAILWAIENQKKKIKIFYDYTGIEKWAIREWKAKNEITQEYVDFIDEKLKLINIEFEYTKAHEGIIYNEKVDELAKKALLEKGYKTYSDGSVYFMGLEKEDWIFIIDEINKSFDIEIEVNEIEREHFNKLILKLEEDKVVINCYNNKKSYVQGKQSSLFQLIVSIGFEKLPSKENIKEVLSNYHALIIEESMLERTFSNILPNFIDNGDIKLKNTLLSAVFNTLIVGYMPDYTYLVFPLFRAMEFYLHEILNRKLSKNTTTKTGKNDFSYFSLDSQSGSYVYNSTKGNLNEDQLNYLNELYNRYNKIRHPYSHWSEESMDTQVITDINTAHELLEEGLKFIDKYYIIF